MAKWIDALETHSKKTAREKKKVPASLPAPVQSVLIQVRAPSGNDPGELAEGHYVVQGDVVTLVDPAGKPIEGIEPQALDGEDPKWVARRLTRERWEATRGGFNRRLNYPPLSIA
jgi:hypothetical protein